MLRLATADGAAGGVLEGIGEEIVGNDPAQPLDILALQETTSNPITVVPIVSGLNSFYGVAGMYSNSTYQATQFGGSTNNGNGNGPNAMIYNTKRCNCSRPCRWIRPVARAIWVRPAVNIAR